MSSPTFISCVLAFLLSPDLDPVIKDQLAAPSYRVRERAGVVLRGSTLPVLANSYLRTTDPDVRQRIEQELVNRNNLRLSNLAYRLLDPDNSNWRDDLPKEQPADYITLYNTIAHIAATRGVHDNIRISCLLFTTPGYELRNLVWHCRNLQKLPTTETPEPEKSDQ